MWWKRGFIILLSLNILVFAGGLILLDTFPAANSPRVKQIEQQQAPGQTTSVQLVLGQDAINTYMDYALSQQADVHKVLDYAHIQFASTWNCDLGVKLMDKVVPFHLVLVPTVVGGNLYLQVKSAAMGQVPVPNSLLFLMLKHLPWPDWIGLDVPHQTLQLNLTKRPQNPYGVRIIGYSAQTQQLSLEITMVPKALMNSGSAS
ncbi:DUF2140 family protein [Alicyclobacillus dauci]|uniref:YpmS family protein n=1 Tax=Alicyclobacillus dauci TaxID=1475485 RepID=A0ABY6Z1L2_9BACL|nr:DUF2140 family protein [Alicyclobacillus dauci]WAH36577.1 YpmS family protein [Alicyclobacillus dauci]